MKTYRYIRSEAGEVKKFNFIRQVWIDEEGRITCNDYDIAFVIPDGSNFQTAIPPEARVMRFYIDEVGEKVPQDASLFLRLKQFFFFLN